VNTHVRIKYASMLAVASRSVAITKYRVYMVRVEATKSNAITSQIAQLRFLKSPYAQMRLVMPIKPMCGGNPLSGSRIRKSMPTNA